jgi:hypothetical protein
MITVYYESIDRFRKTRKYKTLKGAQRFAEKMVGPTPEVSINFGYAVSPDGIGKITCDGCTVWQLFPKISMDY